MTANRPPRPRPALLAVALGLLPTVTGCSSLGSIRGTISRAGDDPFYETRISSEPTTQVVMVGQKLAAAEERVPDSRPVPYRLRNVPPGVYVVTASGQNGMRQPLLGSARVLVVAGKTTRADIALTPR